MMTMARSIRLIVAVAAAMIAAACTKGFEPVETSQKQTLDIQISLSGEITRASFVDSDSGKTLKWDSSDKFTIFHLDDGTSEVVSPSSISEDGFRATLPVTCTDKESEMQIIVSYGDVTYADSLLNAGVNLRQGLFTEGYDFASIPLASKITRIGGNNAQVIVLQPLTALVQMNLKNFPSNGEKIRSISVVTEPQKGSKGRYIGAGTCVWHVSDEGIWYDPESSLTLFGRNGYAEYLELCSSQMIDCGNAFSAYFIAAGIIQSTEDAIDTWFNTFTVSVITENRKITKTFDTSSKQLRTTIGHITEFTLDMKGAQETGRGTMSVAWSPGYIRYDSSAKAYGFGGPEDPGLFFKLGSLVGIDYDTTVSDDRKLAVSKYLVYYKYDTVNQVPYPSDYDLTWEEGTANMAAYGPDGEGNVVPKTFGSWEEIDDYVKFEKPEYDYAHDPCSLVKEGGYKWRMPSVDECNELVTIVNESVSNWRVWSRGSDRRYSNDSTLHVIGITDKDGSNVAFASTSYITNSNSVSSSGKYAGVQTYYVQFSSSYSAYMPTTHYTSKVGQSTKEESVSADVLSIQSFNSTSEETEAELKVITSTSAKASDKAQGATMVRCVRDRN